MKNHLSVRGLRVLTQKLRKIQFSVFLSLVLSFLPPTTSQAKPPLGRASTHFASDIDQTLFKNLGCVEVYRLPKSALNHPLFGGITVPAEKICIPTYDFEGHLNPLRERLSPYRDQLGTDLEIVKLSTGEEIIPGAYFLDPTEDRSWRFLTSTDIKDTNHFLESLKLKIKTKEQFLTYIFILFSFGLEKDLKKYGSEAEITNHLHSMRGSFPKQGVVAVDYVGKELGIKRRKKLDPGQFKFLTNEELMEFRESKSEYLTRLYENVSMTIPNLEGVNKHYLIFAENDFKHLKKSAYPWATKMKDNGVFLTPVVPIIINAIEPEVRNNPDSEGWIQRINSGSSKWFVANIYWPSKKVERTNDFIRVVQLILGLEETAEGYQQAKLVWNERIDHFAPFLCKDFILTEKQAREGQPWVKR